MLSKNGGEGEKKGENGIEGGAVGRPGIRAAEWGSVAELQAFLLVLPCRVFSPSSLPALGQAGPVVGVESFSRARRVGFLGLSFPRECGGNQGELYPTLHSRTNFTAWTSRLPFVVAPLHFPSLAT